MCVCVCMYCENDCSAWLTRSSRKMMMEKGTKNAQCIVNENGKLTITGNQCWCKRTARAKGKQIINCAMLHLSPENFPYYYGFFSRARALAFAPTLPFVLYKTHTHRSSLSVCISLILSVSGAFFAILFYSFATSLIFVCSSSLTIRHAEIHLLQNEREKKFKLVRTSRHASEFARTESSILCCTFLCRILTKWMSEAVNFTISYWNEVRSIESIAILSSARRQSLEMTMFIDTSQYRVALGHQYF